MIIMYSTGNIRADLQRQRERIVGEAVDSFRDDSYFQGKGVPPEDLVRTVCDSMLDLLLSESSRDTAMVERYVEWLYNLIRKESKKIDTTMDFLDRFENIVTRHLSNAEDVQVDVFFEICRETLKRKHSELAR